jgi:hypothetical protein
VKEPNTKVTTKYFVQYYAHPDWIFTNEKNAKAGYSSLNKAESQIESVMKHHADFVPQHYRFVKQTIVLLEEVVIKYGKGW